MKKITILLIIIAAFCQMTVAQIVPISNDEECTKCIKTDPSGEGASAIGIETSASGEASFASGYKRRTRKSVTCGIIVKQLFRKELISKFATLLKPSFVKENEPNIQIC